MTRIGERLDRYVKYLPKGTLISAKEQRNGSFPHGGRLLKDRFLKGILVNGAKREVKGHVTVVFKKHENRFGCIHVSFYYYNEDATPPNWEKLLQFNYRKSFEPRSTSINLRAAGENLEKKSITKLRKKSALWVAKFAKAYRENRDSEQEILERERKANGMDKGEQKLSMYKNLLIHWTERKDKERVAYYEIEIGKLEKGARRKGKGEKEKR
jgi:hypothetical protein